MTRRLQRRGRTVLDERDGPDGGCVTPPPSAAYSGTRPRGAHQVDARAAGFDQAVCRAVVMAGGDSVLALDLASFAILCDRVVDALEAEAPHGQRLGETPENE